MDITRDWHDAEIKQLLKGQEETNTLLRRFLDRQEQLLESNKVQKIEVKEPYVHASLENAAVAARAVERNKKGGR